MGQSKLDGSLQAGPPSVTEGTFPSATFNTTLALTPNPKSYIAADSIPTRRISAAAWMTLSGLGTADTVTEATLVYLRSDSPLDVRVTQSIDGSDVLAVHRIQGLWIFEPPTNDSITLVEVKGNATIEFFVQGNR